MAEVLGEVSPQELRRVFGVTEAAAYLGVSPNTVYRWAAKGRIPHVYIGTRLTFPRLALDEWLEAEARRSVEAS